MPGQRPCFAAPAWVLNGLLVQVTGPRALPQGVFPVHDLLNLTQRGVDVPLFDRVGRVAAR